MTNGTFNIHNIEGIVMRGVGLGIVAGVSMKTIDIVQKGFGQEPKGRKKQAEWKPPKMVFQELKLKKLKF